MDTATSSGSGMTSRPSRRASAQASTPASAAVDTVSRATASIWRPRKFVRFSSGSNSPVQMPVPSRAARDPNNDPRMPMAAGTRTSSPGWLASSSRPATSTVPAISVASRPTARALDDDRIDRDSWLQ